MAVRARLMALNNLSINSSNSNVSNSASASGTTAAGTSNPSTSSDRVGPPPSGSGGSGGLANGPSPVSASSAPSAAAASITERGRNSTHVSPRNSAATVSPIRVDRSSSISGCSVTGGPAGGQSSISTSVNVRGSLDQSTSAVMMVSPRTQVRGKIFLFQSQKLGFLTFFFFLT